MQKIQQMIAVGTDLTQERKTKLLGQNTNELAHFDNFCKDFAFFLITLYKSNLNWLEDYVANTITNQSQEIDIIR